ncbi:TetR/AcrR family transcriptional regulator [Nostoc sp. CHAB 5834]|nr:TetR/AcrR family transcriptional regulator [Nostoc sp. CHAB 5834]
MEPVLSPRAARTRSALISAGVELLVHKPIDAISIDELVAAAGVAKGSFFNHFEDKRYFARALTKEIRIEVEQLVGRLNSGVTDPLERLAGGMIAAAAYALAQPRRTAVLARSFDGLSLEGHPINAQLLQDLREASDAQLIAIPSEKAGVQYWLGVCQNLMGNIVEGGPDDAVAHNLLTDMLQMGLRGLAASPMAIEQLSEANVLQNKRAILA